jgi:hypothetical protein
VALTLVLIGTPVAPLAFMVPVTVGAVVSVGLVNAAVTIVLLVGTSAAPGRGATFVIEEVAPPRIGSRPPHPEIRSASVTINRNLLDIFVKLVIIFFPEVLTSKSSDLQSLSSLVRIQNLCVSGLLDLTGTHVILRLLYTNLLLGIPLFVLQITARGIVDLFFVTVGTLANIREDGSGWARVT